MLDAVNGNARELISFRLGSQEFCVDIMSVREIRGWTPATPLPRAPSFVSGVINLRGAVLPVVDLAARLGFERTEPTQRHVIIVTQIGAQLTGVLVDAVSDIISVGDNAMQAPPDVASEVVREFIQGLLTIDGRLISQISLDRLFRGADPQAIAA